LLLVASHRIPVLVARFWYVVLWVHINYWSVRVK
jgi:hypothetical protein